ncbi:class I SAM-dependent methyltransferase (plasmid) [Rhodospirillum rubrum]|nr:class I SAM-dependent methyltransferase [Rhodospirillum rubrum]
MFHRASAFMTDITPIAPAISSASDPVWRQAGLETLVPRRLVQPDSWAGHIPFAFWVIAQHRPRQCVELGVHTGNSYCAFAQAVEHLGLETKCVGVDHWFGDPQAGYYGEDVYADLKAHHDPLYGHFSRLLRMSFEDGRAYVADGSVDLLHIDGLHTYEAVREDFETWHSKMSERGIVLFHDTDVRTDDFGVWRFWAEIAERFPSFEFDHSNGLGVAYVGTRPIEAPGLAELFAAGSDPQARDLPRRYFARMGEGWINRVRLDLATEQWNATTNALNHLQARIDEIERDRLGLRREREILLQRLIKVDQWDALALQCRDGLDIDLDALAEAIGGLYNADQPQAIEARATLHRVLRHLIEEGTCGSVPGDVSRRLMRLSKKAGARVVAPFKAPAKKQERPLDFLRESGFFDESFYALSSEALAEGRDPLEHYLTVGEAMGVAPSRSFEPEYYARRHPDVLASGMGLLRHYARFGAQEGRQGLSPARRLALPDLSAATREKVVLLLQDASGSDVSLYGLFLARALQDLHEVIVFLKEDGPLRSAFKESGITLIDMPSETELFRCDINAVAKRLVEALQPAYVIANSAETRSFVPPIVQAGFGVVALVQDFAFSVYPKNEIYEIFAWAHHLVFPARAIMESFVEDHPFLGQRRYEILPQGIPALPELDARLPSKQGSALRPAGHEDDFVVVGIGPLRFEKGADLFVSVATAALQERPDANLRFVWIDQTPSFDEQAEFSKYLQEQILRAGLSEHFSVLGALDGTDVYEQADLLALTSRLDPMPRVYVEALTQGKPVACFEHASGLAEVLAGNEETRSLVVPYLDTTAMAKAILAFYDDPVRQESLVPTLRDKARETFCMASYLSRVEALGQQASREAKGISHDYEKISASGLFKASFLTPSVSEETTEETLKGYLVRNRIGASKSQSDNWIDLRRPVIGFNPLVYAENISGLNGHKDPLADWIERGSPKGNWTHPVIDLETSLPSPIEGGKVLLHGHFYYVDLIDDFLKKIIINDFSCDLIITTTDEDRAVFLRKKLEEYKNGSVEVRVVPNIGRDVWAFFTGLSDLKNSDYDVVGHIHGKKSIHLSDGTGNKWRNFLWEHLIGGEKKAAAIAVSALIRNPDIGLVFAEEPFLFGWDKNKELANDLAKKMGIEKSLPRFFDWPIGTMFWAKRKALEPIFDLNLRWEDYPPEPIPVDGTMLHALERLLPFAVEKAGFSFATTYLPSNSDNIFRTPIDKVGS